MLGSDDASWCDDKRTAEPETCEHINDRALAAALDELSARFGAKVDNWRWGDAHQARSEHRPFSRVKPLARFFELRTPVGGDTFTVNVSRVGLKPDPTTGELYLDEHGPSLRGLYDLGDRAQSRVMHSTGQSGILFSPLLRQLRRTLDRRALRALVAVGGAGRRGRPVDHPASERSCALSSIGWPCGVRSAAACQACSSACSWSAPPRPLASTSVSRASSQCR